MATTDPLAHFVGPDVLDPVFQQRVARRIPLGKAMREVMEDLQGGVLCLSVCVAGGVRALQPMHFATKEEEKQAREEYRAAVAKYDYDAAEDAIYGTSPPGGIIGLLSPEDWGHKVTLVIQDRHLLIEWLDPTFPPESYSFAIANPEAVDELLAAAPAHASPAAVTWTEKEVEIIEAMKRIHFPNGDVPPDITPVELIPSGTRPAKLMHEVERLYRHDAEAKSLSGKRETPRETPRWDTFNRLLTKLEMLRGRGS